MSNAELEKETLVVGFLGAFKDRGFYENMLRRRKLAEFKVQTVNGSVPRGATTVIVDADSKAFKNKPDDYLKKLRTAHPTLTILVISSDFNHCSLDGLSDEKEKRFLTWFQNDVDAIVRRTDDDKFEGRLYAHFLKARQQPRKQTTPSSQEDIVTLGNVTIHPERAMLYVGEKGYSMLFSSNRDREKKGVFSPTELKILCHMARHSQVVLSPDAIGDLQIYRHNESSQCLSSHIKRIRAKLIEHEIPLNIKTHIGLGFSISEGLQEPVINRAKAPNLAAE